MKDAQGRELVQANYTQTQRQLVRYVHTQGSGATQWTVTHNLGTQLITGVEVWISGVRQLPARRMVVTPPAALKA